MAITDARPGRRLPTLPWGLGFLDILAALALGPFLAFDVAVAYHGATFRTAPLVVSVLAVPAVLLRRRWALQGVIVVAGASLAVTAAALVTSVPLSPEVVVPLALAYLLIPVVRHRPAPIALGAAAVSVLAVTLAVTARNQSLAPAPVLLVLDWLAVGTGIGLGLYQRWIEAARRQAVEAARQAERLDIARELHDVVAHHVTGIVVQAQAARLVAEQRPEVAAEALRSIEAAGTDALGSMRAMVGSLRGADEVARVPSTSIADIGDLVAQAQRSGHPVSWSLDLPPGADLPDAVSGAAYRIVQESLSNVRRHAEPAASVVVRVAGTADAVEVVVADDGSPARARRSGPAGFGIIGMAERVAALGGTLEAGPPADAPAGWQVRARLPLGPGAVA
jgi:signal transduction histidine kinase